MRKQRNCAGFFYYQTPSMFYLHREKHSITLSKNPNLPNDLLLNTLMISNASYIVSIKHVV